MTHLHPIANILVIDDDHNTCVILTKLLQSMGYRASFRQKGLGALEKLRQDPSINCVLTDLLMPDMDGVTLIRTVLREFPKIKVVAMTAGGRYIDSGFLLDNAEILGAHATIPKPIKHQEIFKMLEGLGLHQGK